MRPGHTIDIVFRECWRRSPSLTRRVADAVAGCDGEGRPLGTVVPAFASFDGANEDNGRKSCDFRDGGLLDSHESGGFALRFFQSENLSGSVAWRAERSGTGSWVADGSLGEG